MKPSIFQYEDYRKYLGDLYTYSKQTRKAFSFRFFAREAGLTAPNFLKLVIDGDRNLSHQSIQKFIKGFKMNRQEAEFFENLVFFNQAQGAEEKSQFYERMSRNRKYREVKQLEMEQFEYYSQWYFAAVRELVAMKGFKEDPKWIAHTLVPNITPKQAVGAIALLLKLKLLERDGDGNLKQVDPTVSSGAEVVKSLAIKNFHLQMLKVAGEAFDRSEAKERDISGVMVSIPHTQIQELKDKIARFRRELLASVEVGDQPRDRLYQLSMQLFPLSKLEEEK